MRDDGARITPPTLRELGGIFGFHGPLFLSASAECLVISAACMGSQKPALLSSEPDGLSARQHIVIPVLLTLQGYLSHKSDSLVASAPTYMTASWFSAPVHLLHLGVAPVNPSGNVKVAASQ